MSNIPYSLFQTFEMHNLFAHISTVNQVSPPIYQIGNVPWHTSTTAIISQETTPYFPMNPHCIIDFHYSQTNSFFPQILSFSHIPI